MPLQEVVALLRHYKEQSVSQDEVYSFLEALHQTAPDEATDDRILEVADADASARKTEAAKSKK